MFKLSLQSRGHSCNNLVKTLILRYSKCAAAKTVELPMGKVRGTHEEGHCGNDFYSFRGIPYGKPPIRELRFSPTQPAEPWGNMVLDCTKDRSVPTQVGISSNQITGSEDCLYINVYTKHFDESEKKLPVIVNFTPGGFCTGGAITEKFGPQYLMREDIVYVMFNYRLSALGFLRINCPELGVSGNAGLHDHLTAMRWVQEYISYFNGDPDNVTIMGTSSGGAMVDFMMCAPQASGLFHRAVMMSGTMTCPWAIVPYADDLFCRLAWEKGYRGEIKATEILKFLRSLPAKEVVSLNHFGDCDYLFGHLYPFAPLVQAPSGNDGGEDALIKGPVVEMYRTAWSVDVPLLIGGTSFEGLFMYPKYKDSKGKMLKMLKKNPALALPYEIHTKLSKTEREKAAEELMRFHFGHRPIDKNSVIQFLDFFSYKLFWHGIHRVVLSRLAHARAPTFLYRFSYDSPTPIVRPYFTGKDITCGVCHAEDMAYLFPLKNRTPRMSGDENLITQRMVGILTTFARTGNPNCEETKSVLWKPLRSEDPFQAMLIDQKLKFGTQSEKEVLLMWDKLYDNHNSLLFGG